jgi:hypothetical protein
MLSMYDFLALPGEWQRDEGRDQKQRDQADFQADEKVNFFLSKKSRIFYFEKIYTRKKGNMCAYFTYYASTDSIYDGFLYYP